MGLKRLVGGLVVGLGATAAANRLLRADPATIEPPLGRPLSTYRWRGFDVAYTEAGDPEAPDLVLLHGINAAASSHEFRSVVDALAEDYHVLAPDLPGFGHSDRPPLLYSGPLYVAFVRDFLRDCTDEPTVVASSLSAAYAAAAVADANGEATAVEDDSAEDDFAEDDAAEDATTTTGLDVRRFILVCPTARTMPRRRPWLRTLIRTPVFGEGLYNLLVSKPAIRYFLVDHAVSRPSAITEEWVEYDWAVAHRPGARFAPASFIGGFLDLEIDLADAIVDAGVPTTIVWGRDAELPPVEDGRDLARATDARLLVFEDADLLPHAEYPGTFVEEIA